MNVFRKEKYKCYQVNIIHGDITMTDKCHKCGKSDKRLFHHHKSYKPEIIVLMCMSCHVKLHNRLREEKICKVPVSEITQLSKNASNKVYHKNNCDRLEFTETMMVNVQLQEQINYNYKTGSITYSINFRTFGSKQLYYVDVE